MSTIVNSKPAVPVGAVSTKAPPRVRRMQITALCLLVVAGVINYMDRGTLAVANHRIAEDMNLSLGEMGLLLSAFSWSYALAQLPVGAMVDRFGPHRLLGFGLVFWSLAQAAGGFVTSFTQFVLSRIGLGIGEAPQFPSAARVVSNWFPVSKRGVPTGIFNSASPLGTAIAPLLLTQLLIVLDWRWVFIITGAAGLIMACLWLLLYRDPKTMGLSAQEQAYLTSETEETQQKVTLADWGKLFSYRATWGMIIGYFGNVYLNWVYLSWLPSYLVNERHMTLARTGFMASVPFFCGFIGCLVAGWLSDKIIKRTEASPVRGRRVPVVVAMLGMAAFTVPAALVQDNNIAIFCISVVIFLTNAASACSWALVTAVAPKNRVASLGSLQNFGGFLGGSLAPIATGFIAQYSSFVPALLTGAAIAFLGATSYFLLVREPMDQA